MCGLFFVSLGKQLAKQLRHKRSERIKVAAATAAQSLMSRPKRKRAKLPIPPIPGETKKDPRYRSQGLCQKNIVQ